MNQELTTVVVGANIITMDPNRPRADAIALAGRNILCVGPLAEVLERAGGGVNIVDIEGKTLIPGFIDPHHHLFLVAADRFKFNLDGAKPRSIKELLDEVARVVQIDSGEGWLRIHGYEPLSLFEHRSPNAAELDSVCPDRPLHLIGLTYHESTLNSLGLARLGWNYKSDDPPGGRIVRNHQGKPTGVLLEQASFQAESISREELMRQGAPSWIDRASSHAFELAKAGITRIGDACVPPIGMTLYEEASKQGRLPITIHRFPVGSSSLGDPYVGDRVTLAGDFNKLPIGPAKIIVDGGERCHLCLSSRQLMSTITSTLIRTFSRGSLALALANRSGWARREADGRYHTGIRLLEDDSLLGAVRQAAQSGVQVALHAVGNGGVKSALDVLSMAQGALAGLSGYPRIEHAMIVDRELIERIASNQALVVAQPSFLTDLGDELTVLPLPSPLHLMPFRTMLDAGVNIAGSSDFPASSFRPLAGIQAAMLRKTAGGKVIDCDEAITVEQGLRMYTTVAAESLGVGASAGTLREGSSADLVVLSDDPYTIPPERLDKIEVLQTWAGGKMIFDSALKP